MFRVKHIFARRQYVRPWALAASVIVLIITLPLLRPLRRPTELSLQEAERLASVQSLVEHHRLIPAAANFSGEQLSIPVFTLLLAGPYWLLVHLGYSLSRDTELVSYLLTLCCATIPAAMAPGLIYRMGRIFQLARPVRACLALGVALCSGLVSYATVINPHAAAAFLVLAAASSLIRSGAASRRSGAAVAMAGFLAATAAVIDFSAAPFLFLFLLVPLAVRAPIAWRAGAIIFFAIGAFPPLLLHGILSTDLISVQPAKTLVINRAVEQSADSDDEETTPSPLAVIGQGIARTTDALLGAHGLLSHYPAVLLGLCGVGSVLHRHWPTLIKTMAVISVCGAAMVIGWIAARGPAAPMLMYADRFFVAFSPLLLFWSGAWLRQAHRPAIWTAASILIAFSAVVGIIGAINPYPPNGYQHYTPVDLVHRLLKK